MKRNIRWVERDCGIAFVVDPAVWNADRQEVERPVISECTPWRNLRRVIVCRLATKFVYSQLKIPADRHKKKKPGFITSTYVWERNDRGCTANI